MKRMLFIFLSPVIGLSSAQAFELTAGLTPPNQQKTTIRYEGTFYQDADVTASPGDESRMSLQNLSFSTPVMKSESSSLALSGKSGQMKLEPNVGNISELYDLEFGLTYTKLLDEKRMWAVTGSYGSSSDRPFYNQGVSTLGLTALYMKPAEENNTWLFLVNYSNNRPILNNIPLPGFAYFYKPSPEFTGVFGAPFAMINWRFVGPWSLNFFTLFPWVIKTSLSYSIAGPMQAYVGMDFAQKTYILRDRTDTMDRLFYDDKKFILGLRSPLSQVFYAELEMGHAFDRAFFVAENYEREPENPTELANAFYLKMALTARF